MTLGGGFESPILTKTIFFVSIRPLSLEGEVQSFLVAAGLGTCFAAPLVRARPRGMASICLPDSLADRELEVLDTSRRCANISHFRLLLRFSYHTYIFSRYSNDVTRMPPFINLKVIF